jgi:hypothetical protein
VRDRREELLSRLVDIARGLPPSSNWGAPKVYRNRLKLTASLRPAIVILDGDEIGAVGVGQLTLGRNTRPSIMQVNPLVYLMAGDNPESIGSDMSALRLPMVNAVLSDDALAEITTSNGAIQYQGCTMDLGQGQTTEATLILSFELHYPLLTAEIGG